MLARRLVISGLMLAGVIAVLGTAQSDHGVPAVDRANRTWPPAMVMLAAAESKQWFERGGWHGPVFEPKRLHVPERRLQVFDPRVVERLPVDRGWLSSGAQAGSIYPFGVLPAIRPGETAADLLGAGGLALWKW